MPLVRWKSRGRGVVDLRLVPTVWVVPRIESQRGVPNVFLWSVGSLRDGDLSTFVIDSRAALRAAAAQARFARVPRFATEQGVARQIYGFRNGRWGVRGPVAGVRPAGYARALRGQGPARQKVGTSPSPRTERYPRWNCRRPTHAVAPATSSCGSARAQVKSGAWCGSHRPTRAGGDRAQPARRTPATSPRTSHRLFRRPRRLPCRCPVRCAETNATANKSPNVSSPVPEAVAVAV